jgi:hypothetical protein
MRTIAAKIIDATHLELLQPLEATTPGAVIQISLPSASDLEGESWRLAARDRLLEAYCDEDAVYDAL